MFWLVTDHVLFNNSWNFDFVAEAWDQEYLHLWPVCYSNSDIKIDLQDSCVQLWPRKLALYTQGYAIDFQKLNGKLKILNQPVGKYADMFDLFFISYHESNADENYQNLLKMQVSIYKLLEKFLQIMESLQHFKQTMMLALLHLILCFWQKGI